MDSEEPPAKIKKENEEEIESVIKEEPVDLGNETISNSSGNPSTVDDQLVNHKYRPMPTWVLSTTTTTNNIKTEENPPEENAGTSHPNGNAIPPIQNIKQETIPDAVPSVTQVKKEDINTNINNNDETDDVSSSTDSPQKPPCRYGANCYRENPDHRRDFFHPPGSDPSNSPEKPRCRYGSACYRKNEEHRKKFLHQSSPNNTMGNRRRRPLMHTASQTSEDSDEMEDFSTDASSDEFEVDFDDEETEFEEEDDEEENEDNEC